MLSDFFGYKRFFSLCSLVFLVFACFLNVRLSSFTPFGGTTACAGAGKQTAEEKRVGSWVVVGPAPLRQGLPPAGNVRSRRLCGVLVARAWSVVAAQDLFCPTLQPRSSPTHAPAACAACMHVVDKLVVLLLFVVVRAAGALAEARVVYLRGGAWVSGAEGSGAPPRPTGAA